MQSTKGEPKFKVGVEVLFLGELWRLDSIILAKEGYYYGATALRDGRRGALYEDNLPAPASAGNVVFGATCLRCREYCEYAEEAPGFKCYSCRSRG